MFRGNVDQRASEGLCSGQASRRTPGAGRVVVPPWIPSCGIGCRSCSPQPLHSARRGLSAVAWLGPGIRGYAYSTYTRVYAYTYTRIRAYTYSPHLLGRRGVGGCHFDGSFHPKANVQPPVSPPILTVASEAFGPMQPRLAAQTIHSIYLCTQLSHTLWGTRGSYPRPTPTRICTCQPEPLRTPPPSTANCAR